MMTDTFLIAQISDLHLGPKPTSTRNAERLQRVVERLVEIEPDLIVVTGDLTDGEDPASYSRVQALLSPLQAKILFAIGNHDVRNDFIRAMPETPTADGFVQYSWCSRGRRVLVLDTVEEGRHAGAFCEVRLGWLRARLAEDQSTPTLIAMHHPPARSGIDWMDADADGPWAQGIDAVLRGTGNVVGLVAGHLHRAVSMSFAGHTLTVAPPTSPQVALDLSQIDLERPDQRPLIVEESPGFALHLWTAQGIVSHFGSVGGEAVLARFDGKTRAMIEDMIGETV